MPININMPSKQDILTASNIARYSAKILKNTSITKMAKDSIFQYPLLISSSIETDEVMVMARAIEMQFAAMVVSTLSMHPSVDLRKYENLSEYIAKFHSNKDIPTGITAATRFIYESASVLDDYNIPNVKELGLACWDIVEEQLDTSILNNVYKPYTRTERIISEKIAVLEAAKNPTNQLSLKMRASMRQDEITEMGNHIRLSDRTGEIVKNDKLSALEPTLIKVQFLVHGDGVTGKFIQPIVLGVKMMIRLIRSDLMVVNMADAAKDSNVIFKFIKWAQGEYKTIRDMIFNISEIKDTAINTKGVSKWWKALKRRKNINNLTKFADNKVLPSTTIIMTSYEVARVAEITGVNLAQIHNALKVMSKYYLLGFGIFDTETKVLSMIFDGDTDFAESTLGSLKNAASKNIDLSNTRDVAKLLGRI